MKNIFKKLIYLILVLLIGENTHASEQICVRQANAEHRRIVENSLKKFSSNSYNAIQEVKNQDRNLYESVIQTVSADINGDEKKDIFYALGHPLSSNCGYDVGILLNLGKGQWQKFFTQECHNGCWILLDSSNAGFRNIQSKNGGKCLYRGIKKKYVCR